MGNTPAQVQRHLEGERPPAPPIPVIAPARVDPSASSSPGSFVVPEGIPAGALHSRLEEGLKLPAVRDARLSEMADEYESDPSIINRKYRPSNIKDEFWAATQDLMLHMNCTRIAMRSLGGVYAGTQTRRVTGNGKYVEHLNDLVNDTAWRSVMSSNFEAAALFGTSVASPWYDGVDDTVLIILHDPVRTRIWTADTNVRRVQFVLEFDAAGRWARFVSCDGSGVIRPAGAAVNPGEVVLYETPIPMIPSVVAYGEDRRAHGRVYGASLVRETPGYNRILTNCYYCLGLLIKWQAKSLLVITSGQSGGGESALPKKITQINGNTALLLEQGANAQFISPSAKFGDILEVINSYLSFLAVSLGLPKSVFVPQDNQSAQSARLEGAPMLSTLRSLARQYEDTERELIYKAAYVRHLQDGEVLRMAALRELYQPVVRLDPYDYTDDVNANASNLVSLVNAGIVRLRDAVRRANPEMTEAEVDEHINDAQARVADELQAKVKAAQAAAPVVAPAAPAVPADPGTDKSASV